jgi:hypothetical protein
MSNFNLNNKFDYFSKGSSSSRLSPKSKISSDNRLAIEFKNFNFCNSTEMDNHLIEKGILKKISSGNDGMK